MPALTIKCQFCGSPRVISVSEAEAAFWQRGLLTDRFCDTCKGMTRWNYSGATQAGTWRKPEREAEAEEAPEAPVRLLLIDDDAATLTLLEKVLSGGDFVVEQADSSRGALLKLVNESYDLVISDIRMPGMDGKKLYRFLEEYIPEYRRRVIFLTGDQYSEDTRAFLEDSVCPYSFKPINFGELIRQIRELLNEVGRKGN